MRSPRLALALTLSLAVPAAGQVAPAAPPLTAVPDSVAHRPSPLAYMGRSFLLPGWGQASLDRKLTGALFVGFEGLAISMALKTGNELRYLDRTDTAAAAFRRGERQDWIVLIVFNHLFSGLEAYVSAHLIDFPADLHLRTLPNGRTGFGFDVGLPHH